MSGEVQPRRKKDKARKRRDAGSMGNVLEGKEELQPESHGSKPDAAAAAANDDNVMHVHHDHEIGGDVCCKLIFFVILAAIVAAFGIIFFQSQNTSLDLALFNGTVELPSPSESRFAEYFSGWLDDSEHDDHDEPHLESLNEDEDEGHHDEDEDEDDNHDVNGDEDEHEDEEHTIIKQSEEEHDAEPEEEIAISRDDENDELKEVDGELQDEDESNELENENEAENYDKSEEEEEDENDDDDDDDDDDNNDDNEDEDEDEDDNDNDDYMDLTQEDESTESNEEKPIPMEKKTRKIFIAIKNQNENNKYDIGIVSQSEEEGAPEDDIDETNEIEEIDESEEALKEEEVAVKAEEQKLSSETLDVGDRDDNNFLQNMEKVENNDDEVEEKETGGVAIKLAIGVSLIIVAHSVLVRKWKALSETAATETPAEVIKTDGNSEEMNKSEEIADDAVMEIPQIPDRRKTLITSDTAFYYTEEELKNLDGSEEELEEEGEEEELLEDEGEEEEEEDDEDLDEELEEEEEYDEDDDDSRDLDEEQREEEEEEEKEEEDQEQIVYHYQRLDTKDKRGPQGLDEDEMTNNQEQINDEDERENLSADPNDLKMNEADDLLEENPTSALSTFESILQTNSSNFRAFYGKTRALDKLAEIRRSNQLLNEAVQGYRTLLLDRKKFPNINNTIYLEIGKRCINRMRFAGRLRDLNEIHMALSTRLISDPTHKTDWAVTLLMQNQVEAARKILIEVREAHPHNGLACVLLGFIIKTSSSNDINSLEQATTLLETGIRSGHEGVHDGRFYFHLGDALQRLGRQDEAYAWYKKAADRKLFLSAWQRSLYNVDRLTGRPWWKPEQTGYQNFFRELESKWELIREEGLTLISRKDGGFQREAEGLLEESNNTGTWHQMELLARGRKMPGCVQAPRTCALISAFSPAAKCTRGQAKFSLLYPPAHVHAHCGPTNCRLRAHLGLKIPGGAALRVGNETRKWQEGKIFIFDDSFEHEVWHNGTEPRLVLIVDLWHPELTKHEMQTLAPI